MTRPQILPNLLRYSEWAMGALLGLGVDNDTMMCFYLTVVGHVRSTAMNLNSETLAQQDTGMTADEWLATQEPDLRSTINRLTESESRFRTLLEETLLLATIVALDGTVTFANRSLAAVVGRSRDGRRAAAVVAAL